jgi:hypothetical protein
MKNIINFILGILGAMILVGCMKPGGVLLETDINPNEINQLIISMNNPNINLSKSIGGFGYEWLVRATLAEDGIILAGTTYRSFDEGTDFYLSKIGFDGETDWAYSMGGTHRDELHGVLKTNDGGLLVYGDSRSMFFSFMKHAGANYPGRPLIIKLDKNQKVQWVKEYMPDHAEFFKIFENEDNTLTVVGTLAHTEEVDNNVEVRYELFFVDLDKSGRQMSGHSFKIENKGLSMAVEGVVKTLSGYYITGLIWNGVKNKGFVGYFDLQGQSQWVRSFEDEKMNISGIKPIPVDSGILLVGSLSTKNHNEVILSRVNVDATFKWHKRVSWGSDVSLYNGIIADDGFILVGYQKEKHSQALITRVNKDGVITHAQEFGGSLDDTMADIFKVPDGYMALGVISDKEKASNYLVIGFNDPEKLNPVAKITLVQAEYSPNIERIIPQKLDWKRLTEREPAADQIRFNQIEIPKIN